MKELSIEERAQRYDEAIERAKKWYNAPNVDKIPTFGNRVIEEIFPELIKNNDEKIRGAIIHFISHTPTVPKGRIDKKTMLAWLEKQGEHNLIMAKSPQLGEQKPTNKVESKFKVGDRIYLKPEYRMPNDDTPIADTIHEIIAIDDKHYRFEGSFIFIEDQDKFELVEQNPVGNPEPKFQNGQWITNGDYTWKIVEVKPLDYILQSQDGNIVDDTISHVDEQFHSFTIKDAKDGDVLVSRSPFIYGKQCPYGGLNWCDNKFIKASNFIFTDSPVHPATKEQRDTLFKAMADAGWEFDFEKKELKKIGQRMISAEAKEAMYGNPIDKPEPTQEANSRLLDEDTYQSLIRLGILDTSVRSYNRGTSDYSRHIIQPWAIWQEYNLNPWDADIVKRILRTKQGDSRRLDYEKIIHICEERIRQIDTEG